jgi:phage shock protein A
MAERKSGPVKPPVIDLKAREAEKAPTATTPKATAAEATPQADKPELTPQPEAKPAPATPEPPRPTPPPPPRPQARLAMPWSAITIAAVGGAVLGSILTYVLATWLPLPDNRPAIADPAARLDQQDASVAGLEARLAGLEEQARRTQVSLDATITQLDAGLTDVRQSIAAIPAAAPPVDLAPLTQQLAALEDRVAAIGAGASSSDATALAETISNIEAELASLREVATGSGARAGEVDAAIASLREEINALRSAAPALPAGTTDIGPAVRLPLVVSGLESALGNGRPYAAELASLRALLPDLAVPDPVTAAAEAGLPRPDAVAAELEARVPEILAGRAAQSTGDVGADALEWMKGLLALRPVGEAEGETPEATVSKLEAAVARRDFAGAATLLAALPPAMQAGAGDAGADITALAAADQFLADVRARALGTTAEASP